MRNKFKVQSSKFKVRGFTLVELLVSSAIFIAISTIVVAILFNAFRLSQRTEMTLVVKNNGTSALTQMANALKYAASLDDPISCVPSVADLQEITFTSSFDNGQTTFSCATGEDSMIASNGATLINTNVVNVQSCSFTCSQATVNDPPTITIQFELTSKNHAGTTEQATILPFQTAVTMRNFSR